MPSRTLFCLTIRRRQSVTSTISLRCRVFTRSVIRAWDCMIDLVEKPEANRAAQPHPIRANQLKVIPPGPLINDAVAEVHLAEREPELRQAARELARDTLRATWVDAAKIR